MRWPLGLEKIVPRWWQVARLKPLLERRFGIFERRKVADLVELFPKPRFDARRDSLKPSVEKKGANERFEGVREDRRPAMPCAPPFPLAENQPVRKTEPLRKARQRLLPHQTSAGARQIPFTRCRETAVEERRNRPAEHGVAQELQPLIVRLTRRTVGERLPDQRRLCEAVGKRLLHLVEGGDEIAATHREALASKVKSRLTLATSGSTFS